jgi:hypothetical protein
VPQWLTESWQIWVCNNRAGLLIENQRVLGSSLSASTIFHIPFAGNYDAAMAHLWSQD